jgi:hypothetical protein
LTDRNNVNESGVDQGSQDAIALALIHELGAPREVSFGQTARARVLNYMSGTLVMRLSLVL